MAYETKNERSSDRNHSNYDASKNIDSMYVHTKWYPMWSIMAVGNNFWHTENMNTEYCSDLNSNKLRYRKLEQFFH